MQGLQIFQRAAGVLQLYVHLSQLVCQQTGKVRDRQVAEQVDENNALQCLQFRMGSRVGRNNCEVGELQNRSIKDERQRRCKIRPDPRQKNASHDNDQGIEKIQRTVYASSRVDDQAHECQIGEDLQHCLDAVFLPERQQQNVKD